MTYRGAYARKLVLGLALFLPSVAPACLTNLGIGANNPTGFFLYPNWHSVEVTDFSLVYCDSLVCTWAGGWTASILSVTIFNYGSAVGGTDIADMYFCLECDTGCVAPQYTLTYAGIWNAGAGAYPAWTWNNGVPLILNADPCDSMKGCTDPCVTTMKVFVDVAPCPADKATISLGPGYNLSTTYWSPGGVADEWGCNHPWVETRDPAVKTITYMSKVADKDTAAPGDTITYRIYYGTPGTTPITLIQVLDTQPAYTHYVLGSAVPAPDPGYNPDPGPPLRLRWTVPGAPFDPNLGRTGEIVFKLVVDWGNEPIDPDSGSVAAPENERLSNVAFITYGDTDCSAYTYISPAAETVVKRFLFWQEADNDLLFSGRPGQPPDEITYTTFIKNISTTKTWWKVSVWDTIPPELNPWGANLGLEDPCYAWTMTPIGCPPANGGRLMNGGNTILTWLLDMPPGYSIGLRWKAQVDPSTPGDVDAINIVSIRALGYVGVDGTGDSTRPASFTHQAPIVIPTTYVSYTSFLGADKGNTACPGIFIPFFPLNKKTDFSLYGLEVIGPGTWAQYGGVSPPIANFIGSCTGGFTGYQPGGFPGCKAERAPAMYDPTLWHANCPVFPYHFIYKVVANSPFLWQMRTWTLSDNQDHHLYDPSNSMSFRGFTVYTFRMAAAGGGTGLGSTLTVINTGMDAGLSYKPNLTTTVHLFKWDSVLLSWTYVRTLELDKESAGVIMGTDSSQQGFYRVLSSQSNIIVHHGWNTFDTLAASGCCDNHGTLAPTRETGNVVSKVGAGNFYIVGNGWGSPAAAAAWTGFVVGNTGAATATYRIWRYEPRTVSPPPIPLMLGGTSGTWNPMATHTTGPGLIPADSHAYCGGYDRTGFVSPSTALFRIEVLSGGPIQVLGGTFIPNVYAGGSVIHAADGEQSGYEFWFHQTGDQNYSCGGGPNPPITALGTFDIFCPKLGMAAQCESTDGYLSAYTTDSPDEVVAFMALTIIANSTTKRNWRIQMLDPTQGSVIALYNMCMASEKGYTSPFVRTGMHYEITAPQVVFLGQSFWITIVVIDSTDATNVGYAGTSIFTSTDPGAEIQATPLGSYSYPWQPGDAGVKMFVNVTMTQLGIQSIIANDTLDGSITGLTTIIVVGVDVKLKKEPLLQIAASGDQIQFRICWSNYSSASAANFVITDAVPGGLTYVTNPIQTAASHFCGDTAGIASSSTVAYSTTDNSPGSFSTIPPGGTTAAVKWLKWTIPSVGVNTTGCVCFKANVN